MPQLLLADNIPTLAKATSTTCTLASTSMGQPTRISLGGQQYKLSSTLTLNTATTGLGGLDTGTLGNMALWYVYAVANTSGVVGLVGSLSGPTTGPAGFTDRYKLVGAFYSNDTGLVGATVTITGDATTDWFTLSSSYVEMRGGSNGLIYTNSTTTPPVVYCRRSGDQVEYQVQFTFSGLPATGTGPFVHMCPGSAYTTGNVFLVDLNKHIIPGTVTRISTANYAGSMVFNSNNFNALGRPGFNAVGESNANGWSPSAPDTIANGHTHNIKLIFPVQGWNKTLLG